MPEPERKGLTVAIPVTDGALRGWKHKDWADDVVPVDEVVIDGNLVTSGKPGDLPAFNRAVIKLFGQSRHNERVDATAAGLTAGGVGI
jgi:putative intracellular protease/amidase